MPRERPVIGQKVKRRCPKGRGKLTAEGRKKTRGGEPCNAKIPRQMAPPPTGPPRWTPPGLDLEGLPQEIRTAVDEIVEPLYEQLVHGAADPLEKSTGMTVVHLVWQEILDQHKLGCTYQQDPFFESLGNREEILVRHLQLVDAKIKASYVLVRLREIRRLWNASVEQPASPVEPWAPPRLAPGLLGPQVQESAFSGPSSHEIPQSRPGPACGPSLSEIPPDVAKLESC